MSVTELQSTVITPKQLLYQQKRFRGKINIQKPRKPHYTRALVEEFLTPFYIDPKKDVPLEKLCTNANKVEKVRELGPYEVIISREVRNWFDNSKMIACYHRNSMTALDEFELRVPLRRANMYYKFYSPLIVKHAIRDSSYTGIEPLLCTFFGFIFSPEIKISELEKITKKFPQLVLMGGILEGHVLNLEDFLRYGKMDITSARSGLVQLLQNAGGINLTRQLTHHQSTLVTQLKQIGTNEATPKENEQSVPV